MDKVDEELKELEQKIEQAKEAEEKAPAAEVAPEPEAAPVPEPEPQKQPEPPATPENFDPGDLGKKKGWKKPEDAIKSYEQLEKEFHAKNQELAKLKEQASFAPPVNPYAAPQIPAYAPPPLPSYSAPQYVPPAYGYQTRPSEEQLAASYQMTVEDFRRVMALNRDLNEITVRQMTMENQRRWEQLERSNDKTADMTNVMGDPAFHNPVVQQEMHDVLKNNPSLFTERKPYTAALEKALVNIGRKNMANGTPQNNGMSLPTNPPATAGSGVASSSARMPRVGTLPSQKDAQKMSEGELEKILKGAGAFKTYADM